MIDYERYQEAVDYRMPPAAVTPDFVAEVEERCLAKAIELPSFERSLFDRTMGTQVTLSDGFTGSVKDVIDTADHALTAINEAAARFDTFYEVIGKLTEADRQAIRAQQYQEMLALLEIRSRASGEKPKYNGKSVLMKEKTEFHIGEYIVTSQAVNEQVAARQEQAAVGIVVFEEAER